MISTIAASEDEAGMARVDVRMSRSLIPLAIKLSRTMGCSILSDGKRVVQRRMHEIPDGKTVSIYTWKPIEVVALCAL